MEYLELTGKCKTCPGCMRLENRDFAGTNECQYAPNWKEECKRILKGEQQKI